jgi:hypothetical protein
MRPPRCLVVAAISVVSCALTSPVAGFCAPLGVQLSTARHHRAQIAARCLLLDRRPFRAGTRPAITMEQHATGLSVPEAGVPQVFGRRRAFLHRLAATMSFLIIDAGVGCRASADEADIVSGTITVKPGAAPPANGQVPYPLNDSCVCGSCTAANSGNVADFCGHHVSQSCLRHRSIGGRDEGALDQQRPQPNSIDPHPRRCIDHHTHQVCFDAGESYA